MKIILKISFPDSAAQSEKKTTLLHRTSSLFLRNIAPTITKAEIEAVI